MPSFEEAHRSPMPEALLRADGLAVVPVERGAIAPDDGAVCSHLPKSLRRWSLPREGAGPGGEA